MPTPRWSVDIMRKRAEHLGDVDAPDEQAAIGNEPAWMAALPERDRKMMQNISVGKTN
jgi:hypothetical protein